MVGNSLFSFFSSIFYSLIDKKLYLLNSHLSLENALSSDMENLVIWKRVQIENLLIKQYLLLRYVSAKLWYLLFLSKMVFLLKHSCFSSLHLYLKDQAENQFKKHILGYYGKCCMCLLEQFLSVKLLHVQFGLATVSR